MDTWSPPALRESGPMRPIPSPREWQVHQSETCDPQRSPHPVVIAPPLSPDCYLMLRALGAGGGTREGVKVAPHVSEVHSACKVPLWAPCKPLSLQRGQSAGVSVQSYHAWQRPQKGSSLFSFLTRKMGQCLCLPHRTSSGLITKTYVLCVDRHDLQPQPPPLWMVGLREGWGSNLPQGTLSVSSTRVSTGGEPKTGHFSQMQQPKAMVTAGIWPFPATNWAHCKTYFPLDQKTLSPSSRELFRHMHYSGLFK